MRVTGRSLALLLVGFALGGCNHAQLDSASPTSARGRDGTDPGGELLDGRQLPRGMPNERPVHTVFASAFTMANFEVTKALWDSVAAWAAAHGYDIGPESGSGKAANHPVYDVTWYEAVNDPPLMNGPLLKLVILTCDDAGQSLSRRRPSASGRAALSHVPAHDPDGALRETGLPRSRDQAR